jgi:hypothetical protein
MHRLLAIVLRVLLAAGVVVLIGGLFVVLVRNAKRGSRFAHALGAAMMLFGMGYMRDPDQQTIEEARQAHTKKSAESGDPLNP